MFGKFLEELKQKEIEVSFSAGKIKYTGPEKNITPGLINKLKEFKGDLIKYYWPGECKNMFSIYPGGTKTPLIFIYCKNLSYFLSNYFGSDQPIYVFFDDGWLTGEKSVHDSVESVAKDYINQLKKVLSDGPYFIGGHSLGGVLAYEMAVQLQKSGHKVPLLALFDSMGPYTEESFYWRSNIIQIYKSILKPVGKKLWQFIKMPIFKCFFLIGKSFPKPLLRNYIDTNYLMLLYKYRPEKFNGDLILFRADKIKSTYKFDYGWGEIVNRIQIIKLEGDHLTVIKGNENAEIIGKEIEKHLINI